MYTVTVTALKMDTVIQDPYPTEDKVIIRCKEVGVPVIAYLQDSQYDRIIPQLEALVLSGSITYSAIDGPASQILNDSTVAGLTVANALDTLASGGPGGSDMFISGGRKGTTVSNVYLRGPGSTPMNQSGYVMPFDAKIIAISLATSGPETWILEIRKNGVVTPIASLTAVGVQRAYNDSVDVNIDAGDELQFYCNGSNISAPSGSIIIRRR